MEGSLPNCWGPPSPDRLVRGNEVPIPERFPSPLRPCKDPASGCGERATEDNLDGQSERDVPPNFLPYGETIENPRHSQGYSQGPNATLQRC